MKKLLLLFALILGVSYSSDAQTIWSPMGATWYYDYSNGAGNEGYVKIEYITDSMFAGRDSRALLKTRHWYNETNNTTGMDTIGYEFTYSSNDTVYVYRFGEYRVLYNFDVGAGETYQAMGKNLGAGCDSTAEVIVDSTGTAMYSNHNLRYQKVSQATNADWQVGSTIVERIGDLNYMFPEPGCRPDAVEGGPLRCYTDIDFGTYSTGIASECDLLVGLREAEKATKAIAVYPNPATESVNIKLKNVEATAYHISIFSSTGQLVRREQVQGKADIRLDISELNNGVYLLNITDREGWQGSRTIIKR